MNKNTDKISIINSLLEHKNKKRLGIHPASPQTQKYKTFSLK
jgi:hypothetical protein